MSHGLLRGSLSSSGGHFKLNTDSNTVEDQPLASTTPSLLVVRSQSLLLVSLFSLAPQC